MRIHDKFLYLHPPKTGGWTVRRILERAELGELPPGVYQHCSLVDLPLDLPRFIFATIREPCAWYRSYLHYNCHRDGRFKPGLQAFFGTEPMVLKDALHRMLYPFHHFNRPVPLFGIPSDGRGPGGLGRCTGAFLTSLDIGPYTWMLAQLLSFGGAWKIPASLSSPSPGYCPTVCKHLFDVDLVLDTAAIRSELGTVLERLELDITDALADTADDNVNTDIVAAGRDILPYAGTTAEVFDDEMREWVYHKERHIVALMGYTRPGKPAKNSTVELS